MAYQTGTANTLSELLEKLASFATQLGWQVDKLITGDSPFLYLHNHAGFWSMGCGSNKNILYIFGNTGYDSRTAYNAQPGSSASHHGASKYNGTTVSTPGGPYRRYDFFGTADYLHFFVEIAPGRFRHGGFGTLEKEGNYDGGQYVFGTFVSSSSTAVGLPTQAYHAFPFGNHHDAVYSSSLYVSAVRADRVEKPGPYWYLCGRDYAGVSAIGPGAPPYNATYMSHPDAFSVITSQSQFGAAIVPVPCSILVRTADGLWRRLGTVPDFFVCYMSGIAPCSIHEIFGEKWMVVPAMQFRESYDRYSDGGENSYLMGYVYRVQE